MEKQEILKKLNKNNNFHLSIKVIQVTDNLLIKNITTKISKKCFIINNENSVYDQLKEAYETGVEYVFIEKKNRLLIAYLHLYY